MSTTAAPQPLATEPSAPCSPRQILIWSAWTGLLGGLLELAAFLLKCNLLDPRNYNASRYFPWMFPAAGVLVLAVPGVALAALACVVPRRITMRVVATALLFVPALGLLFRAPIYTAACLLLAAGTAAEIGRRVGSAPGGIDRLVRRTFGPIVALLGLSLALSVGLAHRAERQAPGRPTRGQPNVLLVVLDTVRAESLSLHGYGRDTTPNLRRLARRGVLFENALATAPWTAPSHASMFTGCWPHQLSVGWGRPLDRSAPTLAEHLAARSYQTAGFVANTSYCSYETGLDRGFAHYEDYDVSFRSILLCSSLVQRTLAFTQRRPALARWIADPFGAGRKSAARVHGDFLAWLDRHPGRPFFAFLNDYDAHHPYLAPGPEEVLNGRRPRTPEDFALLRTWWDRDKRGLDARQLTLVRDAYDRCIAYLDREVGRLLDQLQRRGVLDNTIVIVTADHGEHLGEQHLFGHGCSLYRPELHVPLLVIAPGHAPAGASVRTPVSLRDLPATIVGLLDDPARSPFPGRSLARVWSSRVPSESGGALLSEIDAPPEADPNGGRSPACRGPMLSLVAEGWHYIRNGDGAEELYDFRSDAAEQHDLAGSPARAPELRRLRALAAEPRNGMAKGGRNLPPVESASEGGRRSQRFRAETSALSSRRTASPR